MPGTEDKKLEDLSDAAVEYAELRDERQAILAREVEKKAELLALLKKHKKKHYECDGVIVDLVYEKEKVKVKIAKQDVGEDEDAA